jgi:putative ABC transport system permease protein
MRLIHVVLKSIGGRQYQSALTAGFMMVLVAFLLSTTMLINGVEHSLDTGTARLGGDILVVPLGRGEEAAEALLTGKPVSKAWMPETKLDEVARVEGIDKVSPQLLMVSLTGAACCAAWNLYIVAFDPETDFTIMPWLKEKLYSLPEVGEVIGGAYVSVPEATGVLMLYGVELDLIANLEPTGMGMDSTLYMGFDTAYYISEQSYTTAALPLVLPKGEISAVMAKVKPGYDIDEVADRIKSEVSEVDVVTSPELYRTVHEETAGLFRMLFIILGLIWALGVIIIGLVLSLRVTERRREIGMLRAIGATHRFIFRLFLIENGILALGGGIIGVFLATGFVHFFRYWLMLTVEMPLLVPDLPVLIGLAFVALITGIIAALPAIIYPAIRASKLDPAEAMRLE